MGEGPEKQVENKIKDELRRRKIWFFKQHADSYVVPGIPDLIVCYRGRFLGIEVKAPGKRYNTSPVQKVQIELIEKSGGYTVVADSVEIVIKKLEEIDEEIENGRIK